MVATRQQPQALRGLVDQVGLRQDAAADRDHGVGGENERAAQLVVELDRLERGIGFGARQPVGAGARQFAPLRRLIDVGGTQRIGLDAGLIEQGSAVAANRKRERVWDGQACGIRYWEEDSGVNARGTYRKGLNSTTGEQVVEGTTR